MESKGWKTTRHKSLRDAEIWLQQLTVSKSNTFHRKVNKFDNFEMYEFDAMFTSPAEIGLFFPSKSM